MIMMEPTLMNFIIFISVILCVITSLFAAFIIYRRDRKSQEHRFFTVFFIGLAGFVAFYLFLQYPILKDYSYFFQLLSLSTAVLGLFLFYFTLAHEGSLRIEVLLGCSVSVYILPILSVILHPYQFIVESYGYELNVDLWFITFVSTIYAIFGFYALLGLGWLYKKTTKQPLKHKIALVFLGLLIMSISGVLSFTIIPVVINVHILKPFGYIAFIIGILIMTSAFKGKENNEKKNAVNEN